MQNENSEGRAQTTFKCLDALSAADNICHAHHANHAYMWSQNACYAWAVITNGKESQPAQNAAEIAEQSPSDCIALKGLHMKRLH